MDVRIISWISILISIWISGFIIGFYFKPFIQAFIDAFLKKQIEKNKKPMESFEKAFNYCLILSIPLIFLWILSMVALSYDKVVALVGLFFYAIFLIITSSAFEEIKHQKKAYLENHKKKFSKAMRVLEIETPNYMKHLHQKHR